MWLRKAKVAQTQVISFATCSTTSTKKVSSRFVQFRFVSPYLAAKLFVMQVMIKYYIHHFILHKSKAATVKNKIKKRTNKTTTNSSGTQESVLNFEISQCLELIWPIGVSVDKKLDKQRTAYLGEMNTAGFTGLTSLQFLFRIEFRIFQALCGAEVFVVEGKLN